MVFKKYLFLMEINENKSKNKFYLLITSVYGKNNSGTLIRSASAFNCEKIFILGKDKKILKKFFGDHGTVKKMHFEFFESIEQIKEYCLENKIFICGIDIKYKKSNYNISPIQNHEFKGDTLFVLGNSSNIISPELEEICNSFSYVDQYSNEPGDLNLSIVGSIVFHRYGLWANYQQAGLNETFHSEKYIVDKKKINSKP